MIIFRISGDIDEISGVDRDAAQIGTASGSIGGGACGPREAARRFHMKILPCGTTSIAILGNAGTVCDIHVDDTSRLEEGAGVEVRVAVVFDARSRGVRPGGVKNAVVKVDAVDRRDPAREIGAAIGTAHQTALHIARVPIGPVADFRRGGLRRNSDL